MSLALDPPRNKAVLPLSLLVAAVFIAGLVGTFTVGDSAGTTLVVGAEAKLVPAAADTTAKAGSAKFELSVSATMAEGPKLDSTSTGAFNFATRTASIDQHTTLPGAFGTIDSTVLLDGTSLYLGGGTVVGKLPTGKKFVKIPIPAAGALPGATSTPADVMATLKAVSSDIKAVGHETVRGTNTTHYTFTVDGAKAYPGSPTNLQLPAEVWLDSSGRLRRMRTSVDVGALTGNLLGAKNGLEGTLTVNLELYEFGAAVAVTPPPPDQVFETSAANLGSLGSLGFSGFGVP